MKKIFIGLTMMLAACSSLGSKFDKLETPSADEAIIYYYRPSRFVGGGVFYDVNENGEKITTLYNGGYDLHRTAAGKKIVTAKTEKQTQIGFEVENGKTYFVRGKVHMGILLGRPALKLVPQEKALREIQECRIIEKK